MNETSSCLVITEKRPGSCVGIFFQLFDWNRGLAKKKLFSKKLLPPARAKEASKKFGANDKLSTPKLTLIANENRGGFPNVKKNGVHSGVDMEQKHDMQAPSLVARLMGLESIPAARRDKSTKDLGFEICSDSDEKFVGNRNGSDKEDTSLEKGLIKHELRPQKLQKTGQFDRRTVTRFGAEALQFKSVLPRSRKHQHPKLASPVKSPGVLSGKNASRWVDAAARILEPGLQSTNRAKCALTYSDFLQNSPNDKVTIEGKTVLSPEIPWQTGYYANATNSFAGQSSCENCGNHNLSDVVILRPNMEEHPLVFGSSVSSYVSASSQGPGISKPRPPKSSPEQEIAIDFQSHDQAVYLASKASDNVQKHNETFRDGKPFSTNGQDRWHFSSQPRKPIKDERTPIALKHMTRTSSQMSLSRERIAVRSKLNNLHSRRASSAVKGVSGAKDFVDLNRSLSGRTRPRMPNRVDKSKLEAESKSCNRQDDSLSNIRTPIRKRRIINVSGQVESRNFVAPSFGKQDNVMRNGMTLEGIGHNSRSMTQSCVTSKLACQEGGNNASSNKNVDVISSAINSPMKKKTAILSPREIEKREDRDDFVGSTTSEHKKLILDENDRVSSFQKPLPVREDALGALLVQKLKELTCQDEDELETGGTPPIRTTPVIFQELISALTADRPIYPNDEAIGIDQNGDSYYGNQDPHDHLFSPDHLFNGDEASQARTKTPRSTATFIPDRDHFSPGSVLEASFSTDSCISSSLDDNSGHKMHVHELMDHSYDLPRTNIELLDSATSLDKVRTGSEIVTDVVNFVSKILNDISLSGVQLSGSKRSHVKEVLLDAELLFGIAVSHTSHRMKRFSIGPFLLNELEALAASLWTNSNCLLGFEEAKEEHQLREFLFDCVIEYLDSTFAKYCKSGFRAFTRLPSCMNTVMLIRGVGEEVRSWTELAEKIPDEIIEWEMSHSLGKWTDFDIEAFETDAEIAGDILQILVEEIVRDICESRLGSF